MFLSKNMTTVLSMMPVYYNLRTVFLIVFVILLILTVIYGVKVRINTIISKKTGLHKKKEIAMMKAGKSIKRRRVSQVMGEQYTEQIMMQKVNENDNGTMKLGQEQTGLLDDSNNVTTVLNQADAKRDFYLVKNIMVVHGVPLSEIR